MLSKKALAGAVLATVALAANANAASITVGWWNQSSGGDAINTVYTQSNFNQFTLSGQNFGTFNGVLTALKTPTGYYESAINDIFNTGFADTGRIYVGFNGVTVTGSNPLTLPTQFGRAEDPLPGWALVEEVFICKNSVLFCDDGAVLGGGTRVGDDYFTGGRTGSDTATFAGMFPGKPFNITEVFHIVNDGVECCHLAASILTKPIGDPVAVPGPIVGAGLPGLLTVFGMCGMWWKRRKGMLAA
jgi:hypothetical protein